MPGRCEPFHRMFPLSGGLMRVLGPIVQILGSAMLDRGQHLAVSDAVAGQLVGNDHPRHILQALEQLTEESLGGVAVSARLDQHIEHVPVLVDRPPQVMQCAVDFDEDLVEMPLVAGPGPPSAQLVGVGLPKLGAPPADRLVTHHDTAFEHHLLDFTEAEREPKVQPHTVIDDLDRVAVALVRQHCGAHATFSQFAAFNNVTVPGYEVRRRVGVVMGSFLLVGGVAVSRLPPDHTLVRLKYDHEIYHKSA